jgi:hypothetical protein
MQKPLLTSSQVSIILSSTILLVCAIGIFLAGYALQQHTVNNLHASLRPHNPVSRHANAKLGDASSISGLQKPLDILSKSFLKNDSPFDWSRLAYAQVVKSHEDICDALIVLHELYRSQSAAPKLLLFPRAWIREQNGADPIDETLEGSVRLLKKASKLYRAILVPIGPLVEGSDGILIFVCSSEVPD